MSGGFQDLGLLPELVKATQDMGWVLPSDVQDEAIPLMLGGGDVMVAAETGSGKTGAFALPALQLVHELKREEALGPKSAPTSGTAAAPAAAAVELGPPLLNTADRTPLAAVSPDGLITQCRHERQWGGVRGTVGVVQGKVCYEVSMRDEGICRVGWSTVAAKHDLGTDGAGWGFGGTGKKSHKREFTTYGEPFSAGDVVGVYLSLSPGAPGSVSFSKNGKWLGEAFPLPPAVKGPLYPAFAMKNAELAVNFGSRPFAHPPCAPGGGWVALAEADPTGLRARAPPPAAPAAGPRGKASPLVLIVEPARDLAEQTAVALEALGREVTAPVPVQGRLIGGGDKASSRAQAATLSGPVDIVTATMGSLLGAVKSGKADLTHVRLLVLDEADHLCGNAEGREELGVMWQALAKHPKKGTARTAPLQVAFFSATLHSPEVQALGQQLCHHPTWVDLKGRDSVPETVHHAVVVVDPTAPVFRGWKGDTSVPTDKVHRGGAKAGSPDEWSAGVKVLKPRVLVDLIDALHMEQVLVFCRTNLDCDNLQAYLTSRGGGRAFTPGHKAESGKENPYSCCVLAGARGQGERRAALAAFKEGDVRVLIATDVAARGIDVRGLPYVVNMTLPDEPENYIHRVGRVGRAERMGLAISLVAPCQEKVWFYDKRKWKGKTLSTALASDGGCCIWYDEPGLLASVEHRLQATTKPLRPVAGQGGKATHAAGRGKAVVTPATLALPVVGVAGQGSTWGPPPSQAAAPTTGHTWSFTLPPGMGQGVGGVSYGDAAAGGGASGAHVAAMAPTVEVLKGLELAAQSSFLALQNSLAGCAADLDTPALPGLLLAPSAPVPGPATALPVLPPLPPSPTTHRAPATAPVVLAPTPPPAAGQGGGSGQGSPGKRGRGRRRGKRRGGGGGGRPGKRGRGGGKGTD